jgi:ABC-type nitrate/sulfonate/bicarbonate transport system substrate-binding protein
MEKILTLKILSVCAAGLLAASASAQQTPPPPNDPVTLRVNVFRGASNLPIYMAQEKGYFARRGLTLQMLFTPNSTEQRAGLAAGRFEIAHAAVDNTVAMIEVAKADAVIVAGGDGGMNEVLVRQDINKPSDMRGRTYVVDAPNTAYALIGRKIFKDAGLKEGQDYKIFPLGGSEARTKGLDTPEGAATLLNPPWNFLAKERGAKSLGRTIDLFGPYQANGVFVMRPWAAQNGSALERYLAAFIEGCRAAQDPAQRTLALTVLKRDLKLTDQVAEMTYTELMTKGSGLAPDCAFDMQGFRNVLALRAEMEGQWGGKAPDPARFIDMSFYNRALGHARP